MAQYNSLNVKLSDSPLNKLKSAITNKTKVILRLSSNMIGYSDDETNFCHKLFLTNKQVVNFLQIIHQLILSYQKFNYLRWYNQLDFLVDFLVHYLKKSLLRMNNVIKPLVKSVLILLGLTAAASTADAGIHKKT